MGKKKPIDKVTIERLDMVLRLLNIKLPEEVIDKIIDAVELLEDKGSKATIKDICKIKSLYE